MNCSRFDPNIRDYMNFSCYIPERYSFLRKTLGFIDVLLYPIFQKKINTAKIKRILILRQDRIGDLVVTTPLLRALKDKMPDCTLDIMINPKAVDIIKYNPFINNIIEGEVSWFDYKKNAAVISRVFDFFSSLNEVFKLAKKIKENNYDLIIDCTAKRRNAALSFLAGVYYRIGFDMPGGSFLWSTKVKKNHYLSYIRQIAQLLAPLQIFIKDPSPEIFLCDSYKKNNKKFKELYKIKDNDVVAGVHLSYGGRIGKRWPVEGWINLIEKLIASGGKVILFYGSAEKEDAEELKKVFKENKNFIVPGILDLNEFIERLLILKVFIGIESGPVHISSALNIPTVALFGGSDPALWPIFGKSKIIRKIKGGYCGRRECEDGLCIKAITPEEVYQAAEEVLK